jgi:hypothetical protein
LNTFVYLIAKSHPEIKKSMAFLVGVRSAKPQGDLTWDRRSPNWLPWRVRRDGSVSIDARNAAPVLEFGVASWCDWQEKKRPALRAVS